jgi:hypothetical protein
MTAKKKRKGIWANIKSEDEQWEEILGADCKASLDERFKAKATNGGIMGGAATLYWHALMQKRVAPIGSHYLREIAKMIIGLEDFIQLQTGEINRATKDEARREVLLHVLVKESDQLKRMSLEPREYTWLKLRITEVGRTVKYGEPMYMPQKNIAELMGTSDADINRLEKRMQKIKLVSDYLKKKGIPERKPRGIKKKAVAKRNKTL